MLLLDLDFDCFYILDRDYDKGIKFLSVFFMGEVIWECFVFVFVGGIVECDNLLFVVSIGYVKIYIIIKDGMDVGMGYF